MIVITAPTGLIGHQVLANLLDRGEPIRVIARDPARLPVDTRDRIEVVQGSHGDIDVLTKAFAGADAVFWLVPPTPRRPASRPPTWPSADRHATRSPARGSVGWSPCRPWAAGQR